MNGWNQSFHPVDSLQFVQALLSALLSLVGDLGVVDGGLQSSCNIVGVLVGVIRASLDVPAVVFVVDNLTGVLLGLFGSVWSLISTNLKLPRP